MTETWPVTEFNVFLEERLEAAGIPNRAELARLSGVDPSQFSQWKYGRDRPSWVSLQRIAPHLGVSTAELALRAGVLAEGELPGAETSPRTVTVREAILAEKAYPDDIKRMLINVIADIERANGIDRTGRADDDGPATNARKRRKRNTG